VLGGIIIRIDRGNHTGILRIRIAKGETVVIVTCSDCEDLHTAVQESFQMYRGTRIIETKGTKTPKPHQMSSFPTTTSPVQIHLFDVGWATVCDHISFNGRESTKSVLRIVENFESVSTSSFTLVFVGDIVCIKAIARLFLLYCSLVAIPPRPAALVPFIRRLT